MASLERMARAVCKPFLPIGRLGGYRGVVEGRSMPEFVIVVDAQFDFMMPDGALYVDGAETLVAPMHAWLAALRSETTAGVLFTFDTHTPETYAGSAEAAQFPPHCMRGTAGWASVLDASVVDPAIPLYRLEKNVFAMWEEPHVMIGDVRDSLAPAVPRDAFFARLKADGIEAVTVIGVAADYCVRWAVEGLVERGFRVTVPAAMTRGIARQIDAVVAEEWAGKIVMVG